MLNECKLIYPYYENPLMLERQVENWNRIHGELRDKIKVILVDDHSIKHPALSIFETCKAPKVLARFSEPGIWGMHEARNLGAKLAGKDDVWMFMSDIDLVITPEMLYSLLSKKLDTSNTYTFDRVMAPGMTPHRYHCNSFLVQRQHYWFINGYDVDFTGTFGGGYGGDGTMLRQLYGVAPRVHLEDIKLIGHERNVVDDANTTQWDREEWKKKYRAVFDAKRKTGDLRSKDPIRRKWERIL
jgi:hypothetical protein